MLKNEHSQALPIIECLRIISSQLSLSYLTPILFRSNFLLVLVISATIVTKISTTISVLTASGISATTDVTIQQKIWHLLIGLPQNFH